MIVLVTLMTFLLGAAVGRCISDEPDDRTADDLIDRASASRRI